MNVMVAVARDTIVLPIAPVCAGTIAARFVCAPWARRAIAGGAACAGIVVAHLVDAGVPRWPPIDTIGWIPIVTAVAGIGIVAERWSIVLALVLGALAALRVGRPIWGQAVGPALAVGAMCAALVAAQELASRRVPRAGVILAFAATTAGASIATLLAGSALVAQLLGASAAVVGAAGLAAIAFEPGGAIFLIPAVAIEATIVYARLYAALPGRAILWLGVSAATPVLVSPLPLGRRARAVLSLVCAAGLAALGVTSSSRY